MLAFAGLRVVAEVEAGWQSVCRSHPGSAQWIGEICVQVVPAVLWIGEGHRVACHLYAGAGSGTGASGAVQ